jgi:transglutaminase-like putative cysteine protease
LSLHCLLCSTAILLGFALPAAAATAPTPNPVAARAATAPADQPIYAPPAAWVDVAPVPPPPPEEGAPAIQFLVEDHQSRLDPAGDAFYNRSVIKILRPEGLAEVKSLGVIWSPDTESITFHTLKIIRGDQVVDLLGDHSKMLVLRRETNLEQASLDGRITASRQIDGLQTGDVIDFAYTRTHADPVVKGHSFANDALSFPGVAGRYRATISWPKAERVQWKALPGFGEPKIVSTPDGRSQLVLDKTDAEAPKAPVGAPLRFRRVGQVQATSFDSWNEVSKLMAPLYAKASDIAATSPIKAEADAIAAKTTDPKARAFAALQLVENKTRYFFIGMGDGGYVPAEADDTWARRFGDCKAKTALLLALLKTLKVDAEPVLVNLGAGDGIDELPPSLAAFNHVLVRVKVGDKSYWLDGTRTGDTNPESMHAPPYRWGLPVRASGATLEKIDEPQITVPQTYSVVHLDASKGLEALAPAKVSITYSGILATQARALVARTPRADFERSLRQQYSNPAGGMEIDQVAWHDDPVRDLFTIEMSGTDDMDWHKNQDLGVREFRVGTGAAPRPFPKREPSTNQDAPFAIPYPSYTRSRTEIVLPDGGKGFTVRGPTGVAKVAGYEIASGTAIQGDVASFTVDRHSVVQEITAAEAEAANHQIRELRDVESFVRAPLQAGTPVPAQS